jgi:hypothetical protein
MTLLRAGAGTEAGVDVEAVGAEGVDAAEVVPGKARLASVRVSGDFDGTMVRRVLAASWWASCCEEAGEGSDEPDEIGDEVM